MQKLPAGKFHGVPPGDTKAILISMPPKGARISGYGRFCCKSPKSSRQDFPAKRRNKPRSSMDVASSSLARSPVSSSPWDEVPHMFSPKSRVQPGKFLISDAKRLLQQNLPTTDLSCVPDRAGASVGLRLGRKLGVHLGASQIDLHCQHCSS